LIRDLLPATPLLLTFLVASIILAVTPGPAVLYIVTRSLTQGRRAGAASVAGVALGNLGNALGASLGLAALFAVSSWAFDATRYCGAAYLIYLGVRALRARAPVSSPAPHGMLARRLFLDGFLVALLNPKTALFFAAFLPQFIDRPDAPLTQAMLLGAVFVLVAACTDSAYVMLASALGPRLANARRASQWGRYISGLAFIGLGTLAAVSGSRPQR
jgi:threonine/homoserine/homoserine lactone efflux protein